MITCEQSMAASSAVMVYSYAQQHIPFVIQGLLKLLVTSVSLKESASEINSHQSLS